MLALFAGGIGVTEVLLILLVILILFGAKKIPELARGMGRGINEFKKGLSEPAGDAAAKTEDKTPKEDADNTKKSA